MALLFIFIIMLYIKKVVRESVLDPIQDKLNPALWNENNTLKEEVKNYILKVLNEWIKKVVKKDIQLKSLIFLGSNTGFQYNDTSDIDINFELSLTEEEAKSFRKLLPNGNNYPGTTNPINFYLITSPVAINPSKGSAWDLLKNEWIVEPSKDKTIVPFSYIIEISKIFMISIDFQAKQYENIMKEIELYKTYLKSEQYDKDEINKDISFKENEANAILDSLKIYQKLIHTFRTEAYGENIVDLDSSGNKSINNMVYKILERFGYIDILKKYQKIRDDIKV